VLTLGMWERGIAIDDAAPFLDALTAAASVRNWGARAGGSFTSMGRWDDGWPRWCRSLASMTLEDILTNRTRLSEDILADVLGAAAGYGVQILGADVKDLIFPGNLQEIMNRVLATERPCDSLLRRQGEPSLMSAMARYRRGWGGCGWLTAACSGSSAPSPCWWAWPWGCCGRSNGG
jgi:hypothetical protein